MMAPAGPMKKDGFHDNPDYALEEMMKQYGTDVLRSAYFYTGDRHLAEDISQETFIRAYRGWSKFRGDSAVKTWLIAIAVNVCRDKVGLKMFTEQPTETVRMEMNRSFNVEEEALRRLAKSEIMQYVLKLPMLYQEALYLYYYLDMTTREMAEALSAPEGTVRGRLHRAREQLGQLLTKEGFTNETG